MEPKQTSRRQFIKAGAATLGAAGLAAKAHAQNQSPSTDPQRGGKYWPGGERLVISISTQFEAGGEPEFNMESPFSGNPLPKPYPDLPARTWFQYGYREGIPRLLDLWDEFNIKVTSHMVGDAVVKNPDLAKEMVRRGHEAAAHGMSWDNQFDMSRDEEKRFIAKGVEAVEKATGKTPLGYNCNWLRRSTNTLSILQELGFTYHIDDLSRDEPFIVPVNDKPFVIVPYTLRCNDIALIEGRHFSTDQFYHQLKDEFDQLYRESAKRRVMMSISTHDRIGGAPGVVNAIRRFLEYATKHEGLSFKRKDEIARISLKSPTTIKEKVAT
ncbi:polysaccharide deacetylase [Oceaniferula spumae]|uniref:Polysaccharide deacetylase n=1 Tax=Oceaniferula spumae TaxID=2979115 RepID=A0AAT9FLK4_9BACT